MPGKSPFVGHAEGAISVPSGVQPSAAAITYSRISSSPIDKPRLIFYTQSDPQTHLTFLTALLPRIDAEKSQEAHVLLLATIAHVKLLYGDQEGTKADMDSAWKVLDQLSGVDNGVNAAYYGVAADYYKVRSFHQTQVISHIRE